MKFLTVEEVADNALRSRLPSYQEETDHGPAKYWWFVYDGECIALMSWPHDTCFWSGDESFEWFTSDASEEAYNHYKNWRQSQLQSAGAG